LAFSTSETGCSRVLAPWVDELVMVRSFRRRVVPLAHSRCGWVRVLLDS
jgi:hypothetical protein